MLRSSTWIFWGGNSLVVPVQVLVAEVGVEASGHVQSSSESVQESSFVINLVGHCELRGIEVGIDEYETY